MRSASKIAFACHAAVALLLFGVGVVYLLAPSFTPYHAEAAGRSWGALEPPLQGLILGYLKLGGAGFIAIAVALGVLLSGPFRREEPWSRWAVPLVALVYLLLNLYATLTVIARTGASPPIGGLFVMIGVVLVGALFSLVAARAEG
jgi:hypothetical protein